MPTDGTGNPKVQRRLAAILAADIASYSALMVADEARTVRDLKAHQSVVLPMIAEHGGRIIDTAGDGILAEFGSVVNAVECAATLQKTMAERNSTVEATRQMQFRIGINLGDVIHDEARVYGDGVNIAARLEGIAQPGGICISGTAYEHVHKKLPLAFTDIGEQQLKNIASAVRIYRIELHNDQNISRSQEKKRLSLPDKPSIAVLPFTNMSGDASQEYFSDGITEDIITELSRFSELFVIAAIRASNIRASPQTSGRLGAISASVTCWKVVYGELVIAFASLASSSMRPPVRIAGPSATIENLKMSSLSRMKSLERSSRYSLRT
jgi:adenylate cyclase